MNPRALAEALVAGRFQRVRAVVTGPLSSALRGLEPLQAEMEIALRDVLLGATPQP